MNKERLELIQKLIDENTITLKDMEDFLWNNYSTQTSKEIEALALKLENEEIKWMQERFMAVNRPSFR